MGNAGVRISFYDVDPHTLAPDLASLARVIAAGARVVVVAPLYGVPVDTSELEAVVSRHGGIIVEDAAQGHGASLSGRRLGALARISVISFARGKGWTGGNGGALLLRGSDAFGAELPDAGLGSEALTQIGLLAQWSLGRAATYSLALMIPGLRLGETVYHTPQPLRSLSRVSAASLLTNHPAATKEAAARRSNAARLRELIENASGAELIRIPANGMAGYLRFPLLVPNRSRGFAGRADASSLGIAPSYPMILPSLPAVAGRVSGPETRWPGAEVLANSLVTVPTHSGLEERDFIALARLFRSGV
jgi:dTDP-4-amino-4,6-dideoxygalactose transaminase